MCVHVRLSAQHSQTTTLHDDSSLTLDMRGDEQHLEPPDNIQHHDLTLHQGLLLELDVGETDIFIG